MKATRQVFFQIQQLSVSACLKGHFSACYCVHSYFAELSDAGVCGLPSVLSVYSVLLKEQVDFVIFWVVALWN